MKKKITIVDIANDLNISKTTVSFVLNGKAREKHISIKQEETILAHVKKIGYRPNYFAQMLCTGRTKMIGMIVADISDPFFSSIARFVEEHADKKGYKILYGSTENSAQKAIDLIYMYRTQQVDGYIIAAPPGIEMGISDLIDDGFAVVLFDRTLPGIEVNNVIVDNYKGSYTAIKHLVNNGYNHIAMITIGSDQMQMLERQRGYIQALDETGRPHLINKVICHDHREKSICEIQGFLDSHKQIDAIFFATNYVADSGLEAIRNLKLDIPEDLSVVVFDDYNLFRLFTPSITAVSQPIKEISEQVINLMIELLDPETKNEVKTIVLPTSLIVRNSSLPRKRI
jgi:LacI family transcriptional regulator